MREPDIIDKADSDIHERDEQIVVVQQFQLFQEWEESAQTDWEANWGMLWKQHRLFETEFKGNWHLLEEDSWGIIDEPDWARGTISGAALSV